MRWARKGFIPRKNNDMKKFVAVMMLGVAVAACSENVPERPLSSPEPMSKAEIARMLSELPLGREQMMEVKEAVAASSGNGYDEEYMMKDLVDSPGSGVGDDAATKAARAKSYAAPLRSLIAEYLSAKYATKAGAADVEKYMNALSESDLQIYWPYSDGWDGETLPLITFDPGYGAETNYGYELRRDGKGFMVVDSVIVDEKVAQERPVWVVNTNDDSAFTPLEMFVDGEPALTKGKGRMLVLKSFNMLRNYDSWFGGASEFFIKCGAVDGFTARTEAEMKLYNPTVTDFMIVVKRSSKGKPLDIGTILMSNFTSQIESIAFLVTEDDGGTVTNWKCSAVVKINSKSYGFEVDIPYKDKDDIVWRGQLSSSFLTSEDEVTGRLGDVEITFALE